MTALPLGRHRVTAKSVDGTKSVWGHLKTSLRMMKMGPLSTDRMILPKKHPTWYPLMSHSSQKIALVKLSSKLHSLNWIAVIGTKVMDTLA